VIEFGWRPLLLLLFASSAAAAAAAAWYALLLLACTGCRRQCAALRSCSCGSLPGGSCHTGLLLLLLLLLL
jgi:hypothetical protein